MMKHVLTISFLSILSMCALVSCTEEEVKHPTLTIDCKVDGAKVMIDTKNAGTIPGGILAIEVPAGQHFLEISYPGYETFWKRIVIKDKDLDLTVNMVKKTATVIFESKPEQAALTVNGSDIGETPARIIELPVGEHEAVFKLPGFDTKTVQFSVEDQRPIIVSCDLESVLATVNIVTNPFGANVSIDGVPKGRTPRNGTPLRIDELPEGKHTYTVDFPGYHTHTDTFIIKRGDVKTIKVPPLAQKPGSFSISSTPQGVDIYMNNKLKGQTPLDLTNLKPGRYSFRFKKEGYDDVTRVENLSAGLRKPIKVDMKVNVGSMSFYTIPPNVSVFVDGKNYGVTKESSNKTISQEFTINDLSPGVHVLELSHPRFKTKKQKFLIQRGKQTALKNVRLAQKWLPTHVLTRKNGKVERGKAQIHENGDITWQNEKHKGKVKVQISKDEIKSIVPLEE